ncbi:hypothetical protein CAEBREN_03732 [Caenorhabditis brenneri]|uniref:C2H2-type domain-containing protein n=1 Tax=Caenorhabditis brenneri TaxID=135651 RepID=G0P130_CAEBE|nr:hypothetical protein CAEBREN_03732 [Caenorhabditis brenneri]
MSFGSVTVFVSVTHGLAKDCRRANARLKETLNTSFLLILKGHEYHRLKNQVAFDVRPNFLVHKSFREIIESDRKIRLALLAENSVGVQVGPEMVAKIVDACPPSSNTFCQTDFKTWTKDTAGQTDVVEIRNSEVQCESSETLSFTTVQTSDYEPVQNISVETVQSVSPMRSVEVQQDESDDEIIFIQSVPRAIQNQPREVKQEEQENAPAVAVQHVVEPIVAPIVELPPPPPPPAELEVKQEPAEQVLTPRAAFAPPLLSRGFTTPGSVKRVFNNSFMATPLSSRSNSTTFYSASTTSQSGTECSPSSNPKKQKLSEVDMCQMCLEVSYFTPLEEYCQHVLEMHSSISRFKCNVCQHKFPGSIAANYHARAHMSEGDLQLSPSEPLVSMEMYIKNCLFFENQDFFRSEEHLHRFIKVALQCFPDKFRNVSHQEIAEIIKMDSAVQRQSEKLDEKAVELAELTRIFLLKNCEAAPTAENVEAETKIVADFCAELKAFLESDRSADCPKMPLAVEESIERLLNNPAKIV